MLLSKIKNIAHLEQLAKSLVEGSIVGIHKSPLHGFSVEFLEHKQYNESDNKSYIDWRVYGRSDKLYVKKFKEEANLICNIVFDNSSSMNYPFDTKKTSSKKTLGLILVSAISYLLSLQRDKIGLYVLDDKNDFLHSRDKSVGINQINKKIFDVFNENNNNIKINLSNQIKQLASSFRERTQMIVISDFLSEDINSFVETINKILFKKIDVIVFHLYHNSAENLLNSNKKQFLNLVDVETNKSIKINRNSVLKDYIKIIEERQKTIKSKLLSLGVDYNYINAEEDINDILLKYYSKRKKFIS